MNEEVKRSTTQLLKAPFGGLGASSIAVGFSQRTGDANFSGLQPHILKMWLKPVSLLSFIQWIINKFENLFSVTPAFMPELRPSRANRGFSPQPEHFGLKPGFTFGISIPGLKPGVSDVNTACKTNRKEFQQFSIYNALSSAPFRGLGVEHLIRSTGNKGFLLISYLTISLTIERLKMIKKQKKSLSTPPEFREAGGGQNEKNEKHLVTTSAGATVETAVTYGIQGKTKQEPTLTGACND